MSPPTAARRSNCRSFLRDNDAVRYREEARHATPRVWYILGHGQHLDF